MFSKDKDIISPLYAQIRSCDWGIWGKEKYTLGSDCQKKKHEDESNLIKKLFETAPERMKAALRYSYGICDLNAFSDPVNEDEYLYLLNIYNEALNYSEEIDDIGFRDLVTELFLIHKTASNIKGFIKGELVNETNDYRVWRSYFYLDFFKFSLINILLREPLDQIVKYSDEILVSKLVLAYFVGSGSFIEKAAVLFPNNINRSIKKELNSILAKIEISPEFPSIDHSAFYNDYRALLFIVKENRNSSSVNYSYLYKKQRFEPFEVSNNYYVDYLMLEKSIDLNTASFIEYKTKPLKSLINLYEDISNNGFINANKIKSKLRQIRCSIDEKYYDEELFENDIYVDNYYELTTHPFFQALLYEGKILSILFHFEYPQYSNTYKSIFSEFIPFRSIYFKKEKSLFPYDFSLKDELPKLVLTHHVHNADCKKLKDKMAINKLLLWNIDKSYFIVSSSSSKAQVVLNERINCIELGYDHYRIHARQHLKAGNQNRVIPNAIDGVGQEYYLTLDDDYFVFPDFAFLCHQQFQICNMDFLQSPLAFKGVFDRVTKGEKIDAESMLFFESTYGKNYPRIYVMPRGTGTIFSFTDGKNSLSDTGGFLVDFSSEDFGQGYVSLIQHNSGLLGRPKSSNSEGLMTDKIHVIGEGVDLNGKLKQLERWNHGTSKIYFHLLLPIMLKAIIRGEYKLLSNKQFILTNSLTALGLTFRFMLFSFFCLPFLFSSLITLGIPIPGIENINFLLLIILINYISLFAMYFYVIGKNTVAYAIRMVLIEPITTMTAIVGYLKGFFGLTPKSWSANKSRKYAHHLYRGVYLLILINVFPIISFSYANFWLYFWPLFNITMIVVGFVIFRQLYIPKDMKKPKKSNASFNFWIISFLITAFVNVWFFIEEFKFETPLVKMIILCVMIFNFYMGFRSMIINALMAKKQLNFKKMNNLSHE